MGLSYSLDKERKRIEVIFDKVVGEVSAQEKDIASIKTVINSLELQGKEVLEVGCGIGDNLIYCAQKGACYLEGFDISGESIRIARQKTADIPNIFFHKCSIEEYNAVKKFDFVLAWGVFEYVDVPLEALKKTVDLLQDGGTLVILISKPIFLKKISSLFRMFLSKLPVQTVLPAARFLGGVLNMFSSIFKKSLYMGESNTYSIEQTVLEGLMVPRYNVFHHSMFTDYLRNKGFSVEFFDKTAPSMVCIIAKRMLTQ